MQYTLRQLLFQYEGVEVPPNIPHQILNEGDDYGGYAYAIWNFS